MHQIVDVNSVVVPVKIDALKMLMYVEVQKDLFLLTFDHMSVHHVMFVNEASLKELLTTLG